MLGWWRATLAQGAAPPLSQGADPRGGSAACGSESGPTDAGLGAGSPRKAGRQRLAESPEQQEVAVGEGPRPGTRSLAHLRASQGARGAEHRLLAGTKPLTSQAPASAPRSDWNTDSPRRVRPPEGVYCGSRMAQEGRGPRIIQGATMRQAQPQRHPPGRRASQPPPGLPASRPPQQELAPAMLLPLQNLGGAPDPTGQLGPGPGLGVADAEEGTRASRLPWPQLCRTPPALCVALATFSLLCPPHPSLTHTRPLLLTCDLAL